MKKLYFTQITDSRFDKNIETLLDERAEKIKSLLNIDGITVFAGNKRKIDFTENTQFRIDFIVTKNTRKLSWNDIYKLVNSVKAVPYKLA